MRFNFTEEEMAFRSEVEDFARTELPADWDDRALYWPAGYGTFPGIEEGFKEMYDRLLLKLGRKGWLSLSWPKECGGMNSMMKHVILDDVMSYHRAPGGDVSTGICGPAITLLGNDDMKKEWLPRIAAGELRFWLGYSEPNSGSDLASIKTRAEDHGDEFILNGQKIWSSGAHIADYGWVLAKTDQGAPKYRGETLMLVDNKTPGITIRPIVNICGIHSFNEVFFDDVRVPKKNVVGQINQGFYSVMVALHFERIFVGAGAFRRVLDEVVRYVKETKRKGRPLSEDPLIRNKLAAMAVEIETLYGFYWRTAWMMDQGLVPELEASSLKVFGTELSRKLAGTAMEILGPYGHLERGSKWAPLRGLVNLGYMDSISGAIGAGTSEIQRGIIATRGLGMPRK
jgi:alkylation response protein AidB-like acyl-CoA dehydrogenase